LQTLSAAGWPLRFRVSMRSCGCRLVRDWAQIGAWTSPAFPAAALLLIYPHEDVWHVPLTVRGSGLRHHTGQVSLPGGRLDAGESIEQGG
jgi:hypothetical protein